MALDAHMVTGAVTDFLIFPFHDISVTAALVTSPVNGTAKYQMNGSFTESLNKPGMMIHTCNLSTLEEEAGRS